ncbi:MAG: hypothetical protein ACKVOQ_19600 [Cyclobacteriaceae bacterium]
MSYPLVISNSFSQRQQVNVIKYSPAGARLQRVPLYSILSNSKYPFLLE